VTVAVSKRRMDDAPTVPMHMEKGSWRHPVFGTDAWVVQTSRAGWFLDANQKAEPNVRREIEHVLTSTVRKLTL
jgi:predicted secreted protein